jgi:hypothetical protein
MSFAENLNTYFSGSIDNIKKNIYDHNSKNTHKIFFKIKDNMMLIFNDFVKGTTKYDIFNNARSLVLNKNDDKYKIIAYTHPVIDYNNSEKMLKLTDAKFIECFEGTLLSIYFSENVGEGIKKWNYSTRKCIDAKESFLNINGKLSNKSHFDMFLETINSLEEFESNLDVTKSYYFVLVHHENKVFVTSYEDKFGPDYKKLVLLFVRDENMNKVKVEDNDYVKKFDIINETFTLDQVKEKIINDTNVMGYITTEENQMYVYHTNFYSNLEKITPYSQSHESMLIELYKNNNLDLHFSKYPENIKYKGSQFDTKGVMYSIFTYLSMTSLNLYYYFTIWKDDKISHKNENEFKMLFGEGMNITLQTMLYKMKGIVIAEKKKLVLDDIKKILKYYISTQDIIRCLKEFEDIKTNKKEIFMKMNQKYSQNPIVDMFIKNV